MKPTYCVNCRYYEYATIYRVVGIGFKNTETYHRCNKKLFGALSLVTGEHPAIEEDKCDVRRQDETMCGNGGKYFESKL